MEVKLISYTKPDDDFFIDEFRDALITNNDYQNLQGLIAYCARVSNPANQQFGNDSDRLIKYLADHAHWSPFEMVNVCLEINTTRDIARQLLRHRSFSFQEFSQRYADVNSLGEPVIREARLQDKKNRQNSIEIDDEQLQKWWTQQQKDIWKYAVQVYDTALDYGIAKEVARAVLPEGLTPSKLYVNGTLRSWLHYISVRSEKSTQKEHRAIAIACANVISKIFPNISEFVKTEEGKI